MVKACVAPPLVLQNTRLNVTLELVVVIKVVLADFDSVKAGVGVGVIVGVGDTHSTFATTGFENSAGIPVAPIPPTFVKAWLQAEVVAHHVYDPLWSLIFPRFQLTIPPESVPDGFDPEYVSPVGIVSYNVASAATLGINTVKLLYESCTVPLPSPDWFPTPGLQSVYVAPAAQLYRLEVAAAPVSSHVTWYDDGSGWPTCHIFDWNSYPVPAPSMVIQVSVWYHVSPVI